MYVSICIHLSLSPSPSPSIAISESSIEAEGQQVVLYINIDLSYIILHRLLSMFYLLAPLLKVTYPIPTKWNINYKPPLNYWEFPGSP